MQPRWHDPQPMAMVQHGGRIKPRDPVPPPETAESETTMREPVAGRRDQAQA
jgi:hypothetical protein